MPKQYIKPPFLTTSFSQSGKNAVRRFDNILSMRKKRLGVSVLAAAVLAVAAAGALVACENAPKSDPAAHTGADSLAPVSNAENDGQPMDIDQAVSAALLSDITDKFYPDCEFYGEGHKILEVGEPSDAGELKAYAVTMRGGYSFMNGMFIKDSGTGVVPAVFTLKKADNGYEFVSVEYPEDGSRCAESIKEMFPERLWDEVIDDKYDDQLKEQEQSQAREYLKSIGRQAEVGDYIDLNTQLPDMDVEASNALLDKDKYDPSWKYPMYIGTQEFIEDGRRYVYETQWEGNKKDGIITYTKYDDKKAVVELFKYSVKGADITLMEIFSQPEKN